MQRIEMKWNIFGRLFMKYHFNNILMFYVLQLSLFRRKHSNNNRVNLNWALSKPFSQSNHDREWHSITQKPEDQVKNLRTAYLLATKNITAQYVQHIFILGYKLSIAIKLVYNLFVEGMWDHTNYQMPLSLVLLLHLLHKICPLSSFNPLSLTIRPYSINAI